MTSIDYSKIAVVSEIERDTTNKDIARVARSLVKLLMAEQINSLTSTFRILPE